jgi:hypothetical protein
MKLIRRKIFVIVFICLAVVIAIVVMDKGRPQIIITIIEGGSATDGAILRGEDPDLAIHPYVKRVEKMLDESPRLIKYRDKWGDTILHYGHYHRDMVRLLVSRGAKVNAKNKEGNTPLHTAVMAVWTCAGGVEELIAQGADVNAKNKKGQTPWDRFVSLHAPFAVVSNGQIVGIKSEYEDDPQREIKERETGRVADALRYNSSIQKP